METKSAWKKYDAAALEELEAFAAEYMEFISRNKTEREFARAAIEQAEQAGYVDLFEAYDEGAIRAAMTNTLAAGETRICLRFSDAVWREATHLLLDQGQIHRVLREAAEQAGARTPGDSLWYSRNDAFCTLTVKVS